MAGEKARRVEFIHEGVRIVVTGSDGHPEGYAWITVAGRQFFMRSDVPPDATRGQVKELARAWLREHPEHLPARETT